MNRLEHEQLTVEQMIRIYCRHKEGNKELCDNCKALIAYARSRLNACKFGNEKPTCKKCPIHCYRRDMKDKIREVMRYSGPRMLIYHPWAAIVHIYHGFSR